MASTRSPRRRQRSVRVAVAVGLMVTATVAVIAAVPLSSYPLLSCASLLAVVCGWAAARIIHTEVVQSRRAHARDRASQAQAFRVLFTERSKEQATFASAMTDRLASRDREVRELEATLRLSERRATNAEERVRRESRRAVEASRRVSELEVALAIRTAEEADELAAWDASGQAEMDTIIDLMAWEDRPAGELLDERVAQQGA
jgi:hypothetical protein